ncbi:MAG TPA: two-component regulator propeller domain-containing protein [Kofleriaceae bacterium]|nr:two-component regulator propeller domain-containing protein [Kofleriaceae bacterium]
MRTVPRPLVRVARGRFHVCSSLLLAAGCSFDPSGSGAGGADGVADGAPGEADARVCEVPISASFAINGIPAGADDPLLSVRVGDTLELDAGASCTANGTAQYTWTLSSAEMATTALPGLTARAVAVFSPLAGTHTISLTVSDGVATSDPVTANVEVVGWEQPAGDLDVRGVATTPGAVWIAATGGAYVQAIGALDLQATAVNDLADGDDDVPNDLQAVFADEAGFVWYGHKPADDTVWRVDADPIFLAQVNAVDFADSSGLGDSAVRDIGATAGGVALATDNGVSVTANGTSFAAPISEENVFAVDGEWAGGAELHLLAQPGTVMPFGAGDNRIRAVLDTGGGVWVGSDDAGIARVTAGGSLADGPFVMPELPSNKIRALVADADGDVWAATDAGVVRYKQDRGAWFAMGAAQGLTGALDVRALAVGHSLGRDFVIAGTSTGLAILTTP